MVLSARQHTTRATFSLDPASTMTSATKLMYHLSDIKAKDEWVDSSRRTHCIICTKKFFLTLGKHHCRRCGDIICSECSTFSLAQLPGAGLVKLRTCRLCHANDVAGGECHAPPSSSSEDDALDDELLQKSEMMMYIPRHHHQNQKPPQAAPSTSLSRNNRCPRLERTMISEEDDRYTVQSYTSAGSGSATDTLSPKTTAFK
ncbi:hypothetical protein H257_12002 [Aphanomyces astaci]|uniref:FYVE-type domain-containing protein n=2 Tax=Aphanomyces astaci TaxID=112090 RepID=W4G2N4_APHAT|nr:hypothetical protein H257_12002 [Aphanomyces astaci]ETV73193.1 hypothetical protein H257_12002 [Aphanomyces astaci]|eukprot:XP_009837398.1 hypothetical protein H257_12002 [Aphanomyces astaci]